MNLRKLRKEIQLHSSLRGYELAILTHVSRRIHTGIHDATGYVKVSRMYLPKKSIVMTKNNHVARKRLETSSYRKRGMERRKERILHKLHKS